MSKSSIASQGPDGRSGNAALLSYVEAPHRRPAYALDVTGPFERAARFLHKSYGAVRPL